jgi:hypothetical protein
LAIFFEQAFLQAFDVMRTVLNFDQENKQKTARKQQENSKKHTKTQSSITLWEKKMELQIQNWAYLSTIKSKRPDIL